jgi:hypothetical protein
MLNIYEDRIMSKRPKAYDEQRLREELVELRDRIGKLEDAHRGNVLQIGSLQALVKRLELRLSDLEGTKVETAP